jgi:hypothetical protein
MIVMLLTTGTTAGRVVSRHLQLVGRTELTISETS